ncbi:MAG: hypothetical protein IKD90_02405 [Clostridiales bacterium]|nr:hypothetical protein [Clostridiales bacterium]
MSRPENKTISSEKNKTKKAILIMTIIEIVLIAGLSILNIVGVNGLVSYDPYYKIYYGYAIAGAILIIILTIAYFKKWFAIQLLSIIVVLLWSTYCIAAYVSCRILTRVKDMEKPYTESEMYVMFNGKLYTWEGKTIIYGLPPEWEDLESRAKIVSRDDSKIPTEELASKGINEGSVIFYQKGYKYILIEVVGGSLFEFIDPDDPPEDTISTATTSIGIG